MSLNVAVGSVALSVARYANGSDIGMCCAGQRTCAEEGAGTTSTRVRTAAINLK